MQRGLPPHAGAVGGGHGGLDSLESVWTVLLIGVLFYGGLFALIKLYDLVSWISKKIQRW